MRILLTGGRGFIGSHFSEALLQAGHDLVVVDLRPPPAMQHDLSARVRHVQGDIRDASLLRAELPGCDAVLHLAAAHHDFGLTEEAFQSVNVQGTRILVEAMQASGVRRLCFFSSVAVYGGGRSAADESTPPAPDSPYGRTKLAAEEVLRDWAARSQANCLVIRPTVVFGEGHYANMLTLIRQIDRGAYVQIGDGRNYKSVCYVKNIVAATLSVWKLDEPARQDFDIYNYVDTPDLTSAEIAKHILKALGRPESAIRVPYALARAIVLPLDLVSRLTGRHFPISGNRIRKFAKSETRFEAERIRATGFRPAYSVPDGIERMVAWYLREKEKGVSFRDAALLPPEQFEAPK